MRTALASLIIISLLFSSLGVYVVGEDYPLPGSDYNNIGLRGELVLSINVTLINLAPYPKFVVVNPLYDFKVYRWNGTEEMVGYLNESTGEKVHILPPDTSKNTLNYRVGFWIYPYETVKVNFGISEDHHYTLPLDNYQDSCPSSVGISVLRYENGTLVGGMIGEDNDLSNPICGVAYPQLLNYPLVIALNQVLPSIDGHVKMLKYEGTVRFIIEDVPDSTDDNTASNAEFPLFFAVSQPLIFLNAEEYNYEPPYSMNYTDYLEFITGYRGLKPSPAPEGNQEKVGESNNLFKLTDKLLSGVNVGGSSQESLKPVKPLDFPIWVVYMGKDVNRLEIRYEIEWENSQG